MSELTKPDPASRSASGWAARHAALKSRLVSNDDPRVQECLAALSFWRCKRVIDAERGHLVPEYADALADLLHEGVPA